MNRNGCIRSDLIADRERQTGYIERATSLAFGIYRPLTDQSATVVRHVLTEAQQDVDDYLAKERRVAAKLKIPKEFGITYVMKGSVNRAMRRGMLQRSFDMNRVLSGVEDHNSSDAETSLPVDVGRMDWFGHDGRKLVAVFDDLEANQELASEAEVIEELLQDAKASDLIVRQPDHISLLKYGRSRDNLDLSSEHKADVAYIVESHFKAASIESIALGKLVVGSSYSQAV